MRRLVRSAILAMCLCEGTAFALAQAAAPSERLLGRFHIWLKGGTESFLGDVEELWGIDSEEFVGLEGYGGGAKNNYFGLEIGKVGVGSAEGEDGVVIHDLDFLAVELNWKIAFDLTHGMTLAPGFGTSGFFIDGEEVDQFGSSDLADFGFGYQGFVDFTWRARRLLLGINAQYQVAIDILTLDYSNLTLGAHLGLAF